MWTASYSWVTVARIVLAITLLASCSADSPLDFSIPPCESQGVNAALFGTWNLVSSPDWVALDFDIESLQLILNADGTYQKTAAGGAHCNAHVGCWTAKHEDRIIFDTTVPHLLACVDLVIEGHYTLNGDTLSIVEEETWAYHEGEWLYVKKDGNGKNQSGLQYADE